VTVEWVDTQAALTDLIASVERAEFIALDTEFHRERTYYPRVALIQLIAPDHDVALIDALAVDVGPLRTLLLGDATIVMHASGQDLEVFQWSCDALPVHLFDTQLAAGFLGYSVPSLSALVDSALGIRLPKSDRLADWLHRPLSPEQRAYAAADVEHLLPLFAWVRERLTTRGRLSWAEGECAELLARQTNGRDPDTAWWRVKEARQLRGNSAGIAQALAAWRERRAAAIDQPPRFVLPDLALVGIAQRPPPDAAALRRVRGIDDRYLRGGAAEAILAAIEEGKAMPREKLRIQPTTEVERDLRPAVTLVSAWVSQLGRDLHLDPTLLATRSDIEALLRGDATGRLTSGWRSEVIGDDVQRLVSGQVALKFNGKGRLALTDVV
jgi:ribonuclease D